MDVGALVNAGSTLLFRIAQTSTLRTYLNVPQAQGIRQAGQPARISVANLPGVHSRAWWPAPNALDPASRTLLVEVHAQSRGRVAPGMYARVELVSPRTGAPLLIPSDSLIARGDGTEVAVVRPDHRVHLQKIDVGRDYGDRIEVAGGLSDGDMVIANPGDTIREGLEVQPVPIPEKGQQK
jgi:RND family efflux transporter MFP subunit